MTVRQDLDYDWLVVGSGFGGSVSTLRLAEKGYRVGLIECGRRIEDGDMPTSTWDLRRYFWAPRLGMRGMFRLTVFRDVTVVSGSGVGGGSLGYANTLYRAPERFYADPQWSGLQDWGAALAPHYDTAERMLGVVTVEADDPADQLLREFGREIGADQSYAKTRVGVYFGTPGETVEDPFFDGAGPARTGCIACGRCMVGCPYNAKNTLPKNYLWLAERAGATITPDRQVVDIRPLGAEDGSDGYAVTTEATGRWLRRDRRVHTARGVVVAAGPLGTNRLLAGARLSGSLPRLSARLGELVRTNSEAILAVTLPRDAPDMTKRVAISSSVFPDPDTHIETVTYGAAGDSMSALFTLLVGDGTKLDAPAQAARRGGTPPAPPAPSDVAARLVAAHDHRARDAVARQRDRAAGAAHVDRADPPAHRAGPRAPEPDVHPRRERVRRLAGRAHRRDRPELADRGGCEHPHHGAHPRRRRDRGRPGHGRRGCAPARVRL